MELSSLYFSWCEWDDKKICSKAADSHNNSRAEEYLNIISTILKKWFENANGAHSEIVSKSLSACILQSNLLAIYSKGEHKLIPM